MNFEESAKKLYTLPWQALYDLAVEKQIDGEEIKHKEKTEIIRRVLLSDITEAEIEAVIDDYTYGNRVTFTLWGFSKTLSVEDISALKALEQTEEDYIDVEGFRNLIKCNYHEDRGYATSTLTARKNRIGSFQNYSVIHYNDDALKADKI